MSGDADGFRALLRGDPSDWGRSKRDAFDRMCEAFPGRAGPPEWAGRDIERRVPEEWRAVYAEVFQQWLGFLADADEARETSALRWRWWVERVWPMLLALCALALLGARLVAVAHGHSRARIALEVSGRDLDGARKLARLEQDVAQDLADGSDAALDRAAATVLEADRRADDLADDARAVRERIERARRVLRWSPFPRR